MSIDYLNKLRLHSINLRNWLSAFLAGFLIGIISYAVWHYVNSFIFNSHSITTAYQITHFDIASLISKFIIITAFILIALFLPTYRYGIVIGKLLVLVIGIYGGIVLGAFIGSSSHVYSGLIYLGVQLFSIIWLLAIGTSPINYIEKVQLTLIPFFFLIIASFLPIAFLR